jgi:hypothetical protein
MAKTGVTEEECPYLKVYSLKKLKVYRLFFDSMTDIEMFLLKDPPVNEESFPVMMSVRADTSFAGEPLMQSIRYCSGGYSEGLREFMQLSKHLEMANRQYVRQRVSNPAFVGSRPNVPAYVAGAPKNMYRLTRTMEKRVARINMNIAYSWDATVEQIKARGVLTLNLIRILELNNYIVDFRVFEASSEYQEMFICEVVLKKPGQRLDPGKCYYPMCGRSFQRRVISRLKESMPFKNNFGMSYGRVADEKAVKALLNMDENSFYIGTPQSMGILGKDIRQDADAFLSRLNLSDRIRVPRYLDE